MCVKLLAYYMDEMNHKQTCSESLGHEAAALLCVQCKDSFLTAWDLMEHVQAAHMLNIYELGCAKSATARLSPTLESTPPVSPNGKEVLAYILQPPNLKEKSNWRC